MKLNNIGRLWKSNYFVNIMTNYTKTTLYIGVTNNLKRRVQEHFDSPADSNSFCSRYNCRYLVYWERFGKMRYAINREKQIKKWRREKKNLLIAEFNPEWNFLNDAI
jgi:putative endonuclease